MENENFVLVEKEVLAALIDTIQAIQERLDTIDRNTRLGVDLVGALAERFGIA